MLYECSWGTLRHIMQVCYKVHTRMYPDPLCLYYFSRDLQNALTSQRPPLKFKKLKIHTYHLISVDIDSSTEVVWNTVVFAMCGFSNITRVAHIHLHYMDSYRLTYFTKNLSLCLSKERKSYTSGMACWWVNKRICIFGWTMPLKRICCTVQ